MSRRSRHRGYKKLENMLDIPNGGQGALELAIIPLKYWQVAYYPTQYNKSQVAKKNITHLHMIKVIWHLTTPPHLCLEDFVNI